MKITKRQEQAVREGITRVCSNIASSALYISVLTKSEDIFTATSKMKPEEFKALSGIEYTVWAKLVSTQNQTWRDLVQANFELQRDKQLRDAVEILA